MKRTLIITLAAWFIVACNNSSENKETAGTDTMDHSAMDHSANELPMPEIPADAKVFFGNVKDGDVVSSPLKVTMETTDLSVDTANGILKPGSGHHHILIDGPDFLPEGQPVPKDSVHLHFGNAQKEAELSLSPGKHTLTLQFADALHRSYGSQLSSKINIEVKQ